jgi:peroxiredoxin
MSQPETALAAGTPAPDFTLRATPDQTVSLSELRGHPVVLVFYPADWSPVCTDELAVFNQLLPEFQRMDTIVLGISVDGVWCHAAFADARHLNFQLLSDFEPKGKVSREYGVYREKEGSSARATFVVDKDGVIAWREVSPTGINPGAAGPLEAVEKLTGQTAGASA